MLGEGISGCEREQVYFARFKIKKRNGRILVGRGGRRRKREGNRLLRGVQLKRGKCASFERKV